jgi:hypothetical protein
MASRASGRRRDPGPSGPPDRPSLLMLDYLETGQFPGRPAGGPGRPRPDTRARPGARGGSVRGRRRRRRLRKLGSGVRRLTADRRVLTVAAIVAVALAVLVGTSMPLRSTQAGPGRPPAAPSTAPQSPGTSAASPSPAQPSVTSPAAASPSAPPGGTSPGAARSNGGGSRQATPAATTGTPAGASPASSAAATHRVAQAAPAVSVVVVTFSVTSRGAGIFQGKVQIVNDGTKPLADWQAAVALPGDRVVAVANASGLVVHGILLLEPASGAAPVRAGGGVLNVFFVAVGSQPLSGACTFNQVPCG